MLSIFYKTWCFTKPPIESVRTARKGQVTNDSSKDLQQKPDRMTDALEEFEKCKSTENETLSKMNVMGLSGEDAISILGLNESKAKLRSDPDG
jgi:hypothetical protein